MEVAKVDYLEWFPNRVAELRSKKGVSARDMSLSLGQSESYINKIENRRTLPSMNGFFYICEYLGITPNEFFDTGLASPAEWNRFLDKLKLMNDEQLDLILRLMNEMLEK